MRRGGSNEYQQSMFLSKHKKNNVYPCKPQFYHIEVGFKGVKTSHFIQMQLQITKTCICSIRIGIHLICETS